MKHLDYLLPKLEEHGNTLILNKHLAKAIRLLKKAGIKFRVEEPCYDKTLYSIVRLEGEY